MQNVMLCRDRVDVIGYSTTGQTDNKSNSGLDQCTDFEVKPKSDRMGQRETEREGKKGRLK